MLKPPVMDFHASKRCLDWVRDRIVVLGMGNMAAKVLRPRGSRLAEKRKSLFFSRVGSGRQGGGKKFSGGLIK